MYAALSAADGTPAARLMEIARECSPRVARHAGATAARRVVVLDVAGLDRLFGEPRTLAAELRRVAADRGVMARVAVAGSYTTACLLVHQRAGVTVLAAGGEAEALAPLPVALLRVLGAPAAGEGEVPGEGDLDPLLAALQRWGVFTLGAFAALPPAAVAARLGAAGVAWQRRARGEDPRPLVPDSIDERFEQALDLEWPIEGLEPLAFVLGRLLEPLAAHLERRGRAAAALRVSLHLVTREVYERTLALPTALRDARTLRTLAVLDLESHPPAAAIDRVVVAVEPTPARAVQGSLITRPLPPPEQLSTLLARLAAVMGEGRCGAPAEVDSWQPGAWAMTPFRPRECPASADGPSDPPAVALRRFRLPVPARVQVEAGRPVRLYTDRRGLGGGCVAHAAGPWRTSGGWWHADDTPSTPCVDADASTGTAGAAAPRASARGLAWNRDEWDVSLADGSTFRLFHERDTGHWFLDGIVD